MRFTVTWLTEAEDDLARIWINASDRRAVTIAESKNHAGLKQNPQKKGRHVAEGLRVLVVHPLKAYFEVSEQDRIVTVATIRLLPS